jgi:hypothetical protein
MNIWQRIAWYAFGLGLGTILAYFFFSGRDFQCTYLPNNRVLVDMHDQSHWVVSPEASVLWKKTDTPDSAMFKAFLMRGNIRFSDAQVTTRVDSLQYSRYPINLDWKDQVFEGIWERREDTVVLLSLRILR